MPAASAAPPLLMPAPNGWDARRELVEHDADRVDVRARVDRLAADLLGRHVAGRAEDALRPA